MESRPSSFRIFTGSLLIGGTATGAGILALPVVTAAGGVLPASLVYFICWLYSVCTGLLFVEVGLWLSPNANIVSMAQHMFGNIGRLVAWVLYLFLFYTLSVAYVAGGGGLIAGFLGPNFPHWVAEAFFTIFFGMFVYYGTQVVGRINIFLMAGLIASYIIFVGTGIYKIGLHTPPGGEIGAAMLALPVIFASFSYQGIVPSMLTYLRRDPKAMRTAIIGGTLIPFLCYILWDVVIKSIIPVSGEFGLLVAQQKGETAVAPLEHFVPGAFIYVVGKCFAFFALTTSFIGVTLGLKDFLLDSLQVKRNRANQLGICLVVFIPPYLVAYANPKIFLQALGFAGGFGCAILLGFLPIAMVWAGRYRDHLKAERMLPGGRFLLALLGLFVIAEVIIEIVHSIW